MATIKIKGQACHTSGTIPSTGDEAPRFRLVDSHLEEIGYCEYKGKRVVLNIFPSLDTDVCAMSVRNFNRVASQLENTVVLCVSMDLPFAAQRFCVAEGIENVIVASAFRSPEFAEQYGVNIVDGPLAGLLARAVIVFDEKRKVLYSKLVEEITDEPPYEKVIAALKLAE